MKFLSILRASVACSVIAIITPAAAEEAADTTIIVTGRAAADEAEISANKTAGGTDVVSHEDYADKTIVSLRDTLAFRQACIPSRVLGRRSAFPFAGRVFRAGFTCAD